MQQNYTLINWNPRDTKLSDPFLRAAGPSQVNLSEGHMIIDRPIEAVRRLAAAHGQEGIDISSGNWRRTP